MGAGRGQKPPSPTRATEDIGANGHNKVMTYGTYMAPPLRLQRGMTADNYSAGHQPRQSDGADGTRPKNGTHSRCKYGILAPGVPDWGPSNTGIHEKGYGHGYTRRAVHNWRTAKKMGYKTRQRAILARDMQEDSDEERSPPRLAAQT